MKTFTINQRNTKQEIIDGCEEYLAHVEETTLPKDYVWKFGCIMFVIGVLSGFGV